MQLPAFGTQFTKQSRAHVSLTPNARVCFWLYILLWDILIGFETCWDYLEALKLELTAQLLTWMVLWARIQTRDSLITCEPALWCPKCWHCRQAGKGALPPCWRPIGPRTDEVRNPAPTLLSQAKTQINRFLCNLSN